jgi:hypothetical protein
MTVTLYSAEARNTGGTTAHGHGFRSGREAQHWAETIMPDANMLVLRTKEGQSRGVYKRPGAKGGWLDADPWGKSV